MVRAAEDDDSTHDLKNSWDQGELPALKKIRSLVVADAIKARYIRAILIDLHS